MSRIARIWGTGLFNRLCLLAMAIAWFGNEPVKVGVAQETREAAGDSNIDLAFDDYAELLQRKAELHRPTSESQSELKRIIEAAELALSEELVSVLQKKRVASSGDPHDYLSLAPYWWPDPNSEDGFPYVRRDGVVNPATRGDNVDYSAKNALFDRVNVLTLAGFYSGEARYWRRAVEQLEAWFVNAQTRMNPNLNFAQGIPGTSDGRGYGIIEWSGVGRIITPVQLLHARGALSEPSYQAIRAWFTEYLEWLEKSEFGQFERTRANNHGTWYDVQVVGLMLFLGRHQDARQLLETTTKKRIATQIEPDGRQPQELARTKSLSYSKMNLSAFKHLVALGKKVGVDLWDYETDDGRSIQLADAFLKPYVTGEKKWPYQQL